MEVKNAENYSKISDVLLSDRHVIKHYKCLSVHKHNRNDYF